MRPLGLLAHPTHAIQSIPKPARDRCRDLRAAAKQQQHAPWASDQQQPARCPFSGGATLFSDPCSSHANGSNAAAAPLTPLGKAGGAEFATSSLWLSAGSSGQSMPGRLVSGLRKLADLDEFLVELAHEMPHELGLKRSALDNPARRAEVSVAELSSLDAQTECLEMFLEYLPRRYPSLYSVQGSGSAQTITVGPTGEVHVVADYVRAPLELCARIVQEDLVLMRPEGPSPSGPSPAPQPHVMSAAVVVFSFGGLRSKLSQPLRAIHAPVPGFEQQLLALLNRTFSGIRPGTPLWRNNWGLADTGNLDTPLYGEAAGYARRPAQDLHPDQLWLKTEYQTLRRLPSSNHILFTVRTMVEPLSALKANGDGAAAAAAAELASSLRGMAPAMRAYKGLGVPSAAEAVLAYLEGPCKAAS